jgi:23S rRNA (uridine2552-2'-O)-methyltransferase
MSKPYRPKDYYFQQAKRLGLRARSAFKIDEIAKRFGLLRPGFHVLDLGAAPGGFLQVIADAVGVNGQVLGIDVVEIQPIHKPQVTTAVLDVLSPDFLAQVRSLHSDEFDAVISDLAPKTTGIKSTDEARSIALASRALDAAVALGRSGSSFAAKLFMGGGFDDFRAAVRQAYEDVKIARPEATRGRSAEVYVVGLRKRPAASAHTGPRVRSTP